jgi:hypothetical protein
MISSLIEHCLHSTRQDGSPGCDTSQLAAREGGRAGGNAGVRLAMPRRTNVAHRAHEDHLTIDIGEEGSAWSPRAARSHALLERSLSGRERHSPGRHGSRVHRGRRPSLRRLVHESHGAMRRDVEHRRSTVDTTTRVMGMPLDIRPPGPQIELESADWSEYLTAEDVAPDPQVGRSCRTSRPRQPRPWRDRLDGAGLRLGADCGIHTVGHHRKGQPMRPGTASPRPSSRPR